MGVSVSRPEKVVTLDKWTKGEDKRNAPTKAIKNTCKMKDISISQSLAT